jgi:hypothetical protein
MDEETGLRVVVRKQVAEIHFDLSIQHYFLAERVGGEYGTGTGEEYTNADPDDPYEGIYIPIWMPVDDLSEHENIYPLDIKELVLKSTSAGWPDEPVVIEEPMK